MSLPKKDRKVRSNSGKLFPDGPDEPREILGYAAAIAEALRRGFGETHAAVKQVVALTSANERAVKNWFSAKNGPSGENLILLITHSDPVLETILVMAGRTDLVDAMRFVDAKQRLAKFQAALDVLMRSS